MAASELLHLRVKATEGKENRTYEVDMASDATVAQVKAELEAQGAVPAEKQRVIFRGRVLCDEKTLGECQIRDDHTLHMVEKMSRDGIKPTSRSEDRPRRDASGRSDVPNLEGQPGAVLFQDGGMPNLGNLLQNIFQGMGLNMAGASVVLHPTAGGMLDSMAQNSLTRVDINIPVVSEDGENPSESRQGDASHAIRNFTERLDHVARRYIEGPTVVTSRDGDGGGSNVEGPGHEVESYMSVVHAGVACDICRMSPITGPRFKSLSEPDFDLCTACFSKPDAASHGPYTKIEMPVPNPPIHELVSGSRGVPSNQRGSGQEEPLPGTTIPSNVEETVDELRSARAVLASGILPAMDRAISTLDQVSSLQSINTFPAEIQMRGDALQISSILHSAGSLLMELARSWSAIRVENNAQERYSPQYLHETGRQPRQVLPVNHANLTSLRGMSMGFASPPNMGIESRAHGLRAQGQAGIETERLHMNNASQREPLTLSQEASLVVEPAISTLHESDQSPQPPQDWPSVDGSPSPCHQGNFPETELATPRQCHEQDKENGQGREEGGTSILGRGVQHNHAPPSTSKSSDKVLGESSKAKRRKCDQPSSETPE